MGHTLDRVGQALELSPWESVAVPVGQT